MDNSIDLIIRQADIRDVPDLTIMLDEYRRFYGCPEGVLAARQFLTERIQANESVVFVALEAAKAVGFCQLYPSFSTVSLAKTFLLNDMFVVEAARTKGVATKLLDRVKAYAMEVGAVRITLSTQRSNETAQRLYHAAGWQMDSTFFTFHLHLNYN